MEELLGKLIASIQDPVTLLLLFAVVYLWRKLEECKRNHLDCERKNLILANSIEDLAEGRIEDAKSKAAEIIKDVKADIGK